MLWRSASRYLFTSSAAHPVSPGATLHLRLGWALETDCAMRVPGLAPRVRWASGLGPTTISGPGLGSAFRRSSLSLALGATSGPRSGSGPTACLLR
ncbi:hypothetical protein MRX96_017487 [Rhipicephalus microplus]